MGGAGYGRERDRAEKPGHKKTVYQCDTCGFASEHRGHFEVHEKRHRRSDTGVVIETMVYTCKSTPSYGDRCLKDLLARNESMLKPRMPTVPAATGNTRVTPGEDAGNPSIHKGKHTNKSSPSRE